MSSGWANGPCSGVTDHCGGRHWKADWRSPPPTGSPPKSSTWLDAGTWRFHSSGVKSRPTTSQARWYEVTDTVVTSRAPATGAGRGGGGGQGWDALEHGPDNGGGASGTGSFGASQRQQRPQRQQCRQPPPTPPTEEQRRRPVARTPRSVDSETLDSVVGLVESGQEPHRGEPAGARASLTASPQVAPRRWPDETKTAMSCRPTRPRRSTNSTPANPRQMPTPVR